MKRICKICLILFSLIIFFPLKNVKAALYTIGTNYWTHNNQINSREYLGVCSYAHTENHTSADGKKYSYQERINIYYVYNNKWLVTWDKPAGVLTIHENEYKKKQGSADTVFSSKGTSIYISNKDKKNLVETGVCPEKAYVDMGGGVTELCFGTESYCKKQNGFATTFAGTTTKPVTSDKNYDMNDDIKNWFERNSPEMPTCDNFRKKNSNIQEKLEKDILKNFLNSADKKNAPSFFINNSSYKKGMEDIKKQIENLKKKCDREVENDPNLTEEEKNQKKKENEEGYKDATNQVDNVQTEIEKSIEEIPKINLQVDENIDCENIFNGAFGSMLKEILSIIRYAVPILIIGLTIADFVKAITAQDQNEVKKAANRLGKRLIIGVGIFLLPTILNFFLEIAGIEFGVCDL